jgi:hypothetical protein
MKLQTKNNLKMCPNKTNAIERIKTKFEKLKN